MGVAWKLTPHENAETTLTPYGIMEIQEGLSSFVIMHMQEKCQGSHRPPKNESYKVTWPSDGSHVMVL